MRRKDFVNDPDQRSVKDLLFKSFSRPIMARGLQDGLRAAAYDTTCVKDQSSGLEGLFNFHVHEAEEL